MESAGALSRDPEIGLRSRSRPESGFRAGGERDLRSNLERRGSGSVWSKRDRFALRRSASSMARRVLGGGGLGTVSRRTDTRNNRWSTAGRGPHWRRCVPACYWRSSEEQQRLRAVGGRRSAAAFSASPEKSTRHGNCGYTRAPCVQLAASSTTHCNTAFGYMYHSTSPDGLVLPTSGSVGI